MRILFFLLSMLLQKHTGHCTSGDFFQISSVSDEIRRDQLLDAITPYGNVWLKTIHAEKVSVDGDISEIILTDFKDLATFLEIATEQPKYAINLLRFIASEIKKTSFRHFRLEFVPSSEGLKLIFKNTSKELGAFNLDSPYPYTGTFEFSPYLQGTKDIHKSSAYTVSFTSKHGNILVVPRAQYSHFYDFAARASEDEILDFFKHLKEAIPSSMKLFTLATNAGSNAGQTVYHFHFRIEFCK